MKHTFSAKFHKDSTHWVQVVLHSSRRVMRCQLRKLGHDSHDTNAACWQANKPASDGCIAKLHFARDFLTLEYIAHEAAHAAFHRARLLGVQDQKEFEEWTVDSAGALTDIIFAYFDLHKISVKYKSAPKRYLLYP